MGKTFKISLLTLVAFGVYYGLKEYFFGDTYRALLAVIGSRSAAYGLTYILMGIPVFVGTILLHGSQHFLSSLGLQKSLWQGVIVAVVCTLPMLLGYALFFEWNKAVSLDDILIGAVGAAFFEELYFRGFLFGQLFRFTKLGFFPAIIIGALVFASGHVYQSPDLDTMIGIFLTTFLGAGLFAWAYVEWDNNLWVPIFLHFLMNLYWMLFSAGDNALGGLYANIFRVMTISLIIAGTIFYKKRKQLPLRVNKRSLWMQEEPEFPAARSEY